MKRPDHTPQLSASLVGAWIWLVGLSAGAAIVAVFAGQGIPRSLAGAVILGLALLKARVILARFLELNRAPAWLSGFSWVIGLWGGVVLGLFLI